MKKIFLTICILISSLEGTMPLRNLLNQDINTCLYHLEKATDAELWDTFLEGQANLFFDSELQWITQSSCWQKATHILEIGSGNGAYLHKLASTFPEKTFLGIEKLSVEQANAQYAQDNLLFQQGDAEVFHPKLTADIILFRLALQHLKDPILALQHAAKYLTPNGSILTIDSYDKAKRTSHPLPTINQTLEQVAKLQEKQGKGNRKITLELLQLPAPLDELYEITYTNLDLHGHPIDTPVRFEGTQSRQRYAQHSLLFAALLNRTYHIPVDLKQVYLELQSYLQDEDAWTSSGMHFLILRKKS